MAKNNGTDPEEEHPTIKQDFPEATDKIVEIVEVTVEPDYYGITIRFHDRTALTFALEPCVFAFPAYAQWTNGEEKVLKQYKPIRSTVERA